MTSRSSRTSSRKSHGIPLGCSCKLATPSRTFWSWMHALGSCAGAFDGRRSCGYRSRNCESPLFGAEAG
jgi:hypothetical protein